MRENVSIRARPESGCVECGTVRVCLRVVTLDEWCTTPFVVFGPMIHIRDQS